MALPMTINLRRCLLLSLAIAVAPLAAGANDRGAVIAQGKTVKSDAKSMDAKRDPSRDASPTTAPQAERAEQRILEFVGEHQPRLLRLLEFVKAKQPQQYEPAVKDIGRAVARLQGLQQRDEKLYQIELELWQVRSELRLLAAEMSVTKSQSKRKQLRGQLAELVRQEAQQELERLQHLHDRAERQVTNLEEQISERSDNFEERVAASLKQWQTRVSRQTRATNKSSK